PRPGAPPLATLIAAMARLERRGIRLLARSPWFESEPVPPSGQPWFVNAAICVLTLENPYNLLKILHEIEIEFGRSRTVPNEARPLDLDLLAALDGDDAAPSTNGLAPAAPIGVDLSGRALILPHPRIEQRRFVLEPLRAIAPAWRHPQSGLTPAQMLSALDGRAGGAVRLLGAGR
ncbi:MAG TPA: 2-amino-4-hydroxy-6-hydroxymethyldihydropteridine diphosphokinase, partial [Novosphingobium sp.]|nr:2-amino-4-hydroxy-6-hydroxymethyldihydropteridine diphosphokinase [Novosphingobium sp.]